MRDSYTQVHLQDIFSQFSPISAYRTVPAAFTHSIMRPLPAFKQKRMAFCLNRRAGGQILDKARGYVDFRFVAFVKHLADAGTFKYGHAYVPGVTVKYSAATFAEYGRDSQEFQRPGRRPRRGAAKISARDYYVPWLNLCGELLIVVAKGCLGGFRRVKIVPVAICFRCLRYRRRSNFSAYYCIHISYPVLSQK